MQIKNKHDNFYGRLFKFALPLILQYLIINCLNLVDNVMIGKLGEASISGVGLGNQIFFLTNLFMVGITGGASIFMAQFWGKKDIPSIHMTMGFSLILSMIIAVFFTTAGTVFPKFVIGIYSADPMVIELGSAYLQIAAISYLPFAVTMVLVSALRATGNVRIPLLASTIALWLNTVLNYGLIFGNLGMPQLGVQGAAIATTIARTIEACILILVVYGKDMEIAARFKQLFTIPFSFIKKIIGKISLVLLNEGFWAIGTTIYTVIYARMSTDVLTAMNISFVLFNISFVIALGIGQALGIMIGNSLGARDFERAKRDAKRGIPTAFVMGLIIAIIVFSLRGLILGLYNVSPEVLEMCNQVLYAMLGLLPINCIAFTIFIGILRAGGDTKFCTIVDVGALWLVGLPLAAAGAFIWHLPIVWVFVLARMESVSRVIVTFIRYKGMRWVRDIT
ncbi:MAG: MATE family efflux transporter [Eubacteriales bacterium]